jgi:hypothetical protein
VKRVYWDGLSQVVTELEDGTIYRAEKRLMHNGEGRKRKSSEDRKCWARTQRSQRYKRGLSSGKISQQIPMGIYAILELSTIGMTKAQALETYGGAPRVSLISRR